MSKIKSSIHSKPWSFHTLKAWGALCAFLLILSSCSGSPSEIGSDFYPGVFFSPSSSVISVSSAQVISGNSVTITLSLKDTQGKPFVSTLPNVAFQTSGGTSTGTFGPVLNNGDGTYSALFTGLNAGSATMISPVVNGTSVSGAFPAVTVQSGNFSLAQSTVTASATSVTSGSQITLTLTVKDNLGNPSTSGGLTIAFSNSGGTSTGTFSSVVDHQDGTYTSFFTGALGGTSTLIHASIQAGAVTSSSPSVTVYDITPSALTYSANPAIYTKGTSITANSPANSGGPVQSYSVSPALPSGLNLNGGTGVISGIPTVIQTATAYTITAMNTGGSTTTSLSITVNDVAPSGLSYAASSSTYTKGTLISNNNPSNTGGSILSYSISPALPAGLSLSIMSGVISGTPTAISALTAYTVTATNSGGSTTASVSIDVLDVAPTALVYTVNSPTYTKGVVISTNSPTSSGGPIVSYSITPALPSGLSFSTSSGSITGTPSTLSSATVYTVTATNSGGSITASLTLTVHDTAPSSLTYAANPVTFTKGSAASDIPANSGGPAASYSVSPALPAGLSLNTATGEISGTPTVFAGASAFTITATNTGGSTTASVSITINDAAPTSLSYSATPAVYTKNSSITNNNPASSGGSVVSYAISPALPAGLNFSTMTGIISGTPTAVSAMTAYTITATNTGGSTTNTLSITVNDIPPSTLTYLVNPATYTTGTAITANSTSNSGGVITSYSVSPALPAGLSLNTSNGTVTGTPTAITGNTTYTVTGVSSGGNVTASLIITVNDVVPGALSYASTSPTYTKNSAITADTQTHTGGVVTSYSVSPALPLGLSLDTSSGTVSGTPTSVTATSAYTVTALNSGGSATATLTITVNDTAPTNLTYSVASPTYSKGLAIASNTPANTGGQVVSYAINPVLPSGLSLNSTTGVISGTSTVILSTTSYTVTATNTGGSTTANLSITVNDVVASNLVYSADPAIYTKGTAITPNNPSSSGGTITGYSVSPPLPAGLSLDTSTGVISGTPTGVVATANYTLSASNSGGTVTDAVSITVKDVVPSALTYSSNPASYTKGQAITNNSPTVSGGSIISYSVAPSLPGGLVIDSSTGVISGTPTVYTAAASYGVTATNSGGSTTASVSILVKDIPLLSYAGATGTSGSVGSAMTVAPTTLNNQGAAITACAIKVSTTALPAWASLNSSTCTITGTPTGALALTSYTIIATNAAGNSADASVSLSVTYPAPTLTSITPSTGTRNGGTAVTLAGTNFYSGITVTVGGTACTSIVVTSTTQITCTTSAHVIGTVDLVVANPSTTSATLTHGYQFTSTSVTQTWDFNTAGDYAYDHTKIEFTGGVGRLIASQQTDASSSCSTGFGDGVTASCGGTPTGTLYSTATDGLGSSNYTMLSHGGTATDLELSSTWTPAWKSMVGYWKLNEAASATSVSDSGPVGTNSGTPGTGVTLGASGRFGTAASFNGSAGTGIVTNSTLEVGTGDFTLSAWIKSTQTAATNVYPIIAGKDSVSVSTPRVAWELVQSNQTSNFPYLAIATNGTFYYATATKSINDGLWHHVVGVRAGTTLNIYIDGIISGTSTNAAISANISNGANFNIGGDKNPQSQYNGTIDDVGLWSTSLSATAVATLYQHESAAHAGTLTSRVMDGLSSTTWDTLAATTTLPFGKELPDTATTPAPIPVSETQSNYSSLSASQPLMSGILGLWHLDEAAGTTGTGAIKDRSGSGNDGTPNGLTLGLAGKLGTAASFDGSTSYITLPLAMKTGLTKFSFSIWLRTTESRSSTTAWYRPSIFGESSNGTASGDFGVTTNSGYLGMWTGLKTSVDNSVVTTYLINDNQWHHVVATNDGANIKLYLDGADTGSTLPSGLALDSTIPFSIGAQLDNYSQGTVTGSGLYVNAFHAGMFDEAAFWNRAVSAAEVKQLYRRGSNRIRYQVRSCTDNTCTANPAWLGPDGSSQTYFSELNNNSIPKDGADLTSNDLVSAGKPTFTFSNYVTALPSPTPFSVPTNEFFQYRAIMESDDNGTSCNYGGTLTSVWCSPELQSVAVGPTHYDTTSPTISNTTGISYATLQTTFAATESCSSNALYNLSSDGTHWYWYNGTVWGAADGTTTQATLGASINATALTAFTSQYGAGNVFFKVFLRSNTAGSNSCSIDNLNLGITQ